MRYKSAFLAAILLSCTATSVAADEAVDAESVLRLRLQDTEVTRMPALPLRSRFDAGVTTPSSAVPQSHVTVMQAGRTGKFALISTVHPNLVLAVGATDDASEVGRQIDRSIKEMTRSEKLFNRQSDSAPFIGLGVRSGSASAGWTGDATVGVGIFNAPDGTRLSGSVSHLASERYDANTCAHLKLRYRF